LINYDNDGFTEGLALAGVRRLTVRYGLER